MSNFQICCFILISYITLLRAECRDPSEYPVKLKGSKNFLCALFYTGEATEWAINSCNGKYWQVDGETRHTLSNADWRYWINSLIVKAGCTFYHWPTLDYTGEYTSISGPEIVPKFTPRAVSIKCLCGIKPIACIPTDGWSVILRCDGTGAAVSTECFYQKAIGTTYSESVQNSMSVDVKVEAELKMELGVITTTLGVSATTGYDWTKTTEEVRSKTETFRVVANVPAGKVLHIEQAVGHCGNNVVQTELFKITHTDHTREVHDVKYVYTSKDDSEIPFTRSEK